MMGWAAINNGEYNMEKLCIFCKKFNWSKEKMWGMGSEETGPMMEGGDATCAASKYAGKWDNCPTDEAEFRAIILRGENCGAYEPPNAELRPLDADLCGKSRLE